MNNLIIQYTDSEGNETQRRISKITVVDIYRINAFCHLRNQIKTFAINKIKHAVNPDSGEIIEDIYNYLGLENPKSKNINISKRPISSKSIESTYRSRELYPGQRKKEKYALFKCFYHPIIIDFYRKKFFELFNNQCYKCGQTGQLDIDHHLPMALGGTLVPGNLVALCKHCNNIKRDSHPTDFYTEEELMKLQPLLDAQENLFDFKFDWKKWNSDSKGYYIYLGISPSLVEEVFTNPDHPYYVAPRKNDDGLLFKAD